MWQIVTNGAEKQLQIPQGKWLTDAAGGGEGTGLSKSRAPDGLVGMEEGEMKPPRCAGDCISQPMILRQEEPRNLRLVGSLPPPARQAPALPPLPARSLHPETTLQPLWTLLLPSLGFSHLFPMLGGMN